MLKDFDGRNRVGTQLVGKAYNRRFYAKNQIKTMSTISLYGVQCEYMEKFNFRRFCIL